jgi:aerotaxis receptor
MKKNLPVSQREIDYSDDKVFITKTDTKGIITYANDSFVEVSGFAREELLGHNHNVVRHPDMPVWAFEDLWRTVKAGHPWTGIVKNRARNGDHYWVKASVSPIKENGNIIGYISLRKKLTRAEVAAAENLYRGTSDPTGKRDWRSFFRNLPLQVKLQLMIQPGMFIFLILSALTASSGLEEQMLNNAKQGARSIANEVLDSANLLMLTGQIGDADTRTMMLNKIAESNHLLSLQLVRTKHVTDQYGSGLQSEHIDNDAQRQVLDSKVPFIELEHAGGKPVLRVITPYLGSHDHNGTDCLGCHQAAEGSVLGLSEIKLDMSAAYDGYHLFVGKLLAGQIFAQIFLFFFIRWMVGKFVSAPVRDINSHLENLVNGNSDMSNHAEIKRRDEMGKILCSVQSTKVMMGSVIDHITAAAKHVDDRSARLSSVVKNLTEASISQSDSAGSMAAAVEQMSVSVDQIASNAQEVKNISDRSKTLADQGKQVVEQAVHSIEETNVSVHAVAGTISELGAKSDQIQSIVNMIKEIATQTNLLALNAAIEAARAGEQGRGFSVVADEVHKLSDRTAAATEEIQKMITDIQKTSAHAVLEMESVIIKMEAGATLTSNAGKSIVEINDGATQVLTGIEDILSSLKEQTLASHEIATNVERVAQMAESNRVSVESVERTAEKLSSFSLELQGSVQHFRI